MTGLSFLRFYEMRVKFWKDLQTVAQVDADKEVARFKHVTGLLTEAEQELKNGIQQEFPVGDAVTWKDDNDKQQEGHVTGYAGMLVRINVCYAGFDIVSHDRLQHYVEKPAKRRPVKTKAKPTPKAKSKTKSKKKAKA